jgi:hypothetical protein
MQLVAIDYYLKPIQKSLKVGLDDLHRFHIGIDELN